MTDQIEGAEGQPTLLPNEPNTECEMWWVQLDRLPTDEMLGPLKPDKSLKESVAMFGVRQPVPLVWDGADYTVVGGRRRIQAARAVGMSQIPALVGTDSEGMAALDAHLNSTVKPNPFSYLNVISEMYESGASEKAIAQATSLPLGTVRRLWNTKLNLNHALYAAAQKGDIKFSVAEAAAKLSTSQQQNLEAVYQDAGKLTGKDVAEAKRVFHESFQGEQTGLDFSDIPTSVELDAAEAAAQAVIDTSEEGAAAKEHLRLRLEYVRSRKGAKWTSEDARCVEVLLGMLR